MIAQRHDLPHTDIIHDIPVQRIAYNSHKIFDQQSPFERMEEILNELYRIPEKRSTEELDYRMRM